MRTSVVDRKGVLGFHFKKKRMPEGKLRRLSSRGSWYYCVEVIAFLTCLRLHLRIQLLESLKRKRKALAMRLI